MRFRRLNHWRLAASQRLQTVVDKTSMHGHGHAAVIRLALIAHAQ
jgi:hypothetical protein